MAQDLPMMRAKIDDLSRFVARARADSGPESGPSEDRFLDQSLEELHVAHEELRAQLDQIEEANAALDAERTRNADRFDWAPEAYVVTDRHGVLQEVNQAAAQALNLPISRLVGKPLIHFVARRDCRAFRAFVDEVAVAKGASRTVLQLRPRGRGAGCFRAVLSARAQKGLGGSPIAIRWLVRPAGDDPISDADSRVEALRLRVAELEGRLETLAAELAAERARVAEDERKYDATRRRIVRIVQDLRSPALAIKSWGDLVSHRVADAGFIQRSALVLKRNADAIAHRLRDLLITGMPSSRESSPTPGRIDLGPLVAGALEAHRLAAASKGVAFRVSSEPCSTRGEAPLLQQAVCDLVYNAIKFSRSDGEVDVLLFPVADQACLVVRDRGQGIDREALPRVFDSERRDGGSSRADGLGIGLFVARAIIEQHRGSIRAESEGPGHGATFTVLLPGA